MPESRNEELLQDIIDDSTTEMKPQSRVETILKAIIDGTDSSELPKAQSRNEALLMDVLDKINAGGGGGSAVEKDVNFRDYDGTVVYSYTASEFAALTEMPENPDHSQDAIPLTAQGWNWTFADARTYVTNYGKLEVGQTYATADGKTHILIHLGQGRTSPLLGCCPNGTVDVDWGDGTAHNTLTGTSVSTVKWTPTHNYAAPGDYDIKLTCTGMMGFAGSSTSNQYSGLLRYTTGSDTRNSAYQNAIRAVYCANNVTSIGTYVFYGCNSLAKFTIPNRVTSIGKCAFQNVFNLNSIIIPESVTSIGQNALSSSCFSCIIIPGKLQTIDTYAFSSCSGLLNITIPNSVTSIGQYAFYNCSHLKNITIPSGVNSIGSSAFQSCNGLNSINILSGVTSLSASMLNSCYSLTDFIIPSNVTSLGSSVFQNCRSLSKITIPSSVTNIATSAFQNCYSLAEIHFLSTTPPTVAATSVFSALPADCKIYVPSGSLSAYASATNYPSSNTYTYIEE